MYPSSANFGAPPLYVNQFDPTPPPSVPYAHYASTSLHSLYAQQPGCQAYYPAYYGWPTPVAMAAMPLSTVPPSAVYSLGGFAPTMPDGVVLPRSETELENMPMDKFKKLAKSRDGCAFLGRVLHESEFARRAVFAQVCKQSLLVILSKDPTGNYLVQELMNCYGDHLQAICDILKDEWCTLAFHKFGTRVVQKAIEVFPPEEVAVIASKFHGRELIAMKNEFCCHAIQKLIASGTPDQFVNFAEAVRDAEELMGVATNTFGAHCINQLVSRLSYFCSVMSTCELHSLLGDIVRPLVTFSRGLAENEHSNYVVQTMVSCELPELKRLAITECVLGKVLDLAQSKYGSHVLEKALEASSGAELDAICREIFDGYELSATGQDALDIMMFDQYGNYVVQTLLKVCKAAHDGLRPGNATWLQRIDAKIRSVQPRLGKYSSGKKIIELLDACGPIEVLAAAQEQERLDNMPAAELWNYDAGLGI